MLLKTRIIALTGLLFSVLFTASSAHALRYELCKSPQQSMPCAVAFEKLRTYKNPLTKTKFFEDGVHIKDDKLMVMPAIYIAQPDLDEDGYQETIVTLSEGKPESEGLFCQSKLKCPHFILQNRNPEPDKPKLRYYSLIGAAYAYGIGLSTDESLGGYKSLRVYKTNQPTAFNTYQYDKKTDKYYDLGQQEDKG